MENNSGFHYQDDHQIDLPPGFRFHPTDEELITYYLSEKVKDSNFQAIAIGDADLNKSEPWDLPRRAKMGEKEWYFFCLRDKKYPTGLRTNRATQAGYWKATGKDKEIYRGKSLVGMKKTLVFYTGRAPKGEKSNWVMHEYRLEGKLYLQNLPESAKTEWVISRVFEKSIKRPNIPGMVSLGSFGNHQLDQSVLPPLVNSSPSNGEVKSIGSDFVTVPCFSNPMMNVQSHHFDHSFDNLLPSNSFGSFSRMINPSIRIPPSATIPANFSYSGTNSTPNQAIMRALMQNNGSNMVQQHFKTEKEMVSVSPDTGLSADMNTDISSVMSNIEINWRQFEDQGPSSSAGPLNFESMWNNCEN